ncbi:MAG: hypothetical protein R3C51_01685 [Parvularculaceae bacterium]
MLSKIRNFLHRKSLLKATLSGVAGHTGSGAFDYVHYANGYAQFDVALSGVAGTRASLFLEGVELAEIAIDDGKAIFTGDTRKSGVSVIALPGDTVEIRQHGDVILRGDLTGGLRLRRLAQALFLRDKG